jgi:hypothetical protein
LCQPGSFLLSLILPAGFLAVTPFPAPFPAQLNRVAVQGRAAGFSAASPLRDPESPPEAKNARRHRLRRGVSHPVRRRPQRRAAPFFFWLPTVPSALVKEEPWVAAVFKTLDSNGEQEQIRGPPAFTRYPH